MLNTYVHVIYMICVGFVGSRPLRLANVNTFRGIIVCGIIVGDHYSRVILNIYKIMFVSNVCSFSNLVSLNLE